jgi:ferredoxin
MASSKRFLSRITGPSTIAFAREGRRVPASTKYSLFDFLHGYIYARWPYLYIGIGTGEHPLAKRYAPLAAKVIRWINKARQKGSIAASNSEQHVQANEPRLTFADTYHGKVVPLSAARQLVMVNEPVRLLDLEPVIPYQKARDIVLQNPDHIVVLECPCRAARPDPCLPLDVCLIVGEPFAGFVLEHHPGRSRSISQDEAVKILRAEDERGHVHHAFFKDAMLGRFYAICNCCACCCGAMQAQRNGTPMLASSGYLAQVEKSLCIGCQACREFCQFSALKLEGNEMGVLEERCMGCGVCVSKCAQQAITLVRAPHKGQPLEIMELMKNAAP